MGETSETTDQELAFLHERLKAHFQMLRQQRAPTGSPTFALEHGLSQAELVFLKEQVASSVRQGRVRGDLWLPLIVYASEIGYEYSGDEYWQTFEASTPGWAEHGDRRLLRARFRRFTQSFGGAEPTGPWAEHFSIICWPITHAVLPTDLQRQLARLLFENRRALTSELLCDPGELGRHLAARSWHSSSRFQSFAQNTRLLGRVAAALLAGDDARSAFLLDSTLGRIVADLYRERQARSWLGGAKSAAASVRVRGFQGSAGSHDGRPATPSPLPPAADPQLMLREEPDGWSAHLELADLSPLAERLSAVSEDLANCRALVAGAGGPPLSRGRVLYQGQRVRLREWPAGDVALLQLEGAGEATNSLLADQCVLTPGPRWLFRRRERGLAIEVRGHGVRAGCRYLLVSEDALIATLPAWIIPFEIQTRGVFAYAVDAPSILDPIALDVLRRIGLRAMSDVEISPAGVLAAQWDGEGRAEWLAGELPLLAISSTTTVTRSVWALDGHSYAIDWPPRQREILVGFADLEVGTHELHVALSASDDGEALLEGAFEIRIRSPRTRPPSGSPREALAILAAPVTPTLSELWDGRAVIEVLGPTQIEVELQATLQDRSAAKLAQRSCAASLPVEPADWPGLLEDLILSHPDMRDAYGESEACVLRASHEQLGAVTLRCEREFTSLRWTPARDGEGPFIRLIDNTEEHNVEEVRLFEFASPDRHRPADLGARAVLRSRAGGLALAEAGDARAAAILPPTVHDFKDLRVEPRLQPAPRSVEGVLALIDLAELWGSASRPADPFAEHARFKVLRALSRHIAALIGGGRWSAIERRAGDEDRPFDQAALEAAVGERSQQRALARDVARWVEPLSKAPLSERVASLATALALHARSFAYRSEDPRFAEFLLRLASAPESLADWPESEIESDVRRVLDAPVLLRAARLLVLAIDARVTTGAPSSFAGWPWP
jgi:hypothetical protein